VVLRGTFAAITLFVLSLALSLAVVGIVDP